MREIVIPREKAVFRLDRRGRWCNAHGVFRNPKIIAYFNSAIRRDEGGYYVCQQREQVLEKVYFPYEDTALFVREAILGDEVTLVLNTQRRLKLDPSALFIENDHLYLRDGEDRIKFTERALLQLADILEFNENGYRIRLGGSTIAIPEHRCAAGS
jgi:hypothetical protein